MRPGPKRGHSSREDLDALEAAIKTKALPQTEGSFWGASDGSEIKNDLHFIHKTRDAIDDGLNIFYSSWWRS